MKKTDKLGKSLLVILVTFALFTISAIAQDENEGYHNGFSAGPGVIVSDKPYKGMGTETHVFPFVMYQGQNFYLRGPNFGYKIYDTDKLTFDALLSWRFDGYDADDSSDLDGMDDRDMTAELGASISYKDGFGVTRFSFLNDILGKHDGHVLRLSYGKTFRRKNLTLTPSVGLKWQSENFVNYYYGVRSKESRPSRPTYHPSDALNPFMSFRLTYKLNEQWDIFSSFLYQWLDNEISNSPIVDQTYQTSLMFGVIYGF